MSLPDRPVTTTDWNCWNQGADARNRCESIWACTLLLSDARDKHFWRMGWNDCDEARANNGENDEDEYARH